MLRGTLLIAMALSGAMVGFMPCLAIGQGDDAEGQRITGPAGRTETGTASSQEDKERDIRLEQVVVTAQKRTESRQDVPVSVQVITTEVLAKQNLNSLQELTETLPAVHVATDNFSNDMFIRGIGSGGNPGFDQSVAAFVDDIYHGRSRITDATFLDLERIEVLKGPQSTYFGNNAIAGALNVVTKKPGRSVDASVRALYGMFGQYLAEAAVGGPITDTFGARLAVTRNGYTRGWVDNVYLGHDVPRVNNKAGRLTLAFNPIEDFDATLKIEGSTHRTSDASADTPFQWANCPPPAPLPTSAITGCSQALTLGIPLGNNRNAGLQGQFNSLSTLDDVLTVNYRKWGHTLTSVTGFNSYHFDGNIQAGSGGGLGALNAIATTQVPEKYHQFSQELRIASPTGGAIEYLAGAYFQNDRLDFRQEFNGGDLFNTLVSIIPPLAPLIPYLPIAANGPFSQGEHVYSVFGSLTWNVTDRLRLNGGLRGSWVNKSAIDMAEYGTGTQLYGGFVPLPADLQSVPPILFSTPVGTQTYSRSDKDWMPSAGLQYQLKPEAMAYFSYARGFKAGGFNGEIVFNKPDNRIFGPEHVNAYELGIKSEWLDDRVLVNLDVFRSDYRDLQVIANLVDLTTNTISAVIRNAAEARSQGVELETQWAVTNGLRLSANVTYLDSYYVTYPNATTTALQSFQGKTVQDLSGRPTDFAPKWSGSINASYSVRFTGCCRVTAVLTPYFTSSQFLGGAIDDPLVASGGYTRLDGRVGLETPDERWAVDLVGKNLTDRVIRIGGGGNYVLLERPRNVAIQFRYRFE